jgi:predicted aspartyl protease
MPKRRTTCKTSFRATRSTARRTLSARLIACCVALLLTAQTPAPPPATPTLDQILRAHLAARAALKATVDPHTVQSSGTLDGLGLHGTFAFWRDGSRERDDEILGVRTQRTLRDGEREYVQDANGGVRVIHGLLQRRQVTEDFIDSGDFARHPESVVLIGAGKSADGRAIWMLRVAPPGGSTYGVGIDTSTWMVDEKSYPEGDAIATVDYADYRAIEGALIPFVEHDSNGDHAFDISSHVEHVAVNHPIDPSVFAPFAPAVVDAPAPVNVSLDTSQGHVFVRATVKGTPMTFILDSGSQGLFIDPVAAKKVGLTGEGTMEIRGARRTQGLGVAALDSLQIGAARFPVGVISIVDLSTITLNGKSIDGVLGYPFFAATELRIDPEKLTLTIARPGSLPAQGTPVPVDTDRELPEIVARINGVPARFLIDTGNSSELLVFHAFLDAHRGLVNYSGATSFSPNRGVGGSSSVVPAMVNDITIGPFNLYNRRAGIVLSSNGAFADSEDAGNIGWGTLRNFVMTFDLANQTITLDKTRWYDDGRGRTPTERF